MLVSSLLLLLLVWHWRPLPDAIWSVEGSVALVFYALSGLGWGILLLSTFLIDHLEFFGVKQTLCYATRRSYKGPQFPPG